MRGRAFPVMDEIARAYAAEITCAASLSQLTEAVGNLLRAYRVDGSGDGRWFVTAERLEMENPLLASLLRTAQHRRQEMERATQGPSKASLMNSWAMRRRISLGF